MAKGRAGYAAMHSYGGADGITPVGGGGQESSSGDRWRDPQARAMAVDRQDPGDKRWASASPEDAKWGTRGGRP